MAQVGIPNTVKNPPVDESKGVEVKTSAPATPVKEETVKTNRKRK